MPCFYPIRGFRGPGGKLVLAKAKSSSEVAQTVACGRCIGCRMDRARDWGVRIVHEAKQHESSSFLTLTYSDECLPADFSVSVREVQLFLKRLRDRLKPERIRFYACGEYGSKTLRPHYHLIIFGFGFPDKKLWRRTASGSYTYRSALLENIWPFGSAEIGVVTRQSGAYVARYCLKKVSGPPAADHYRRVHPVSLQEVVVQPEFAVMSRRPGIGYGWFNRWESDCYPSGFIIMDGQKVPIPRYYRDQLRDRNEDWLQDDYRRVGAKGRRHRFTDAFIADNTEERHAVRAESLRLKAERLKRDL